MALNKGAENMYGWAKFDALKMNIEELVHKARLKKEKTLLKKLKRAEAVNAFKTRLTTKGGKLVDIWLTGTVLTDDNGRSI